MKNEALDSLSLITKQTLTELLQLSEEDTLLLVTNFISEDDVPIACTVSVCVGTRLNLIGNIHSPIKKERSLCDMLPKIKLRDCAVLLLRKCFFQINCVYFL